MKIAEVCGVSKIYDARTSSVHVLNNISFAIERGEFVGIMGPSGAGKSTLLNIMATIDQPTTGRVKIDNQEINQLNDHDIAQFRREKLGFIFQGLNLIPNLTIQENIVFPLLIRRIGTQELQQRLTHVAEVLSLTTLLDRYPSELSIGQRQRVAAARAMIGHPKLVFADEPTGSLDSKSATELLQYLAQLNLNEDITIMMVTHDAFTASYCNRILFIKDGAIFSEVVRSENRRAFFQRIIDMQAAIGGGGKLRDLHDDF